MKFSYRLQEEPSGWLAHCVESDAMGEGKTEQDAIRSLREALEERMFRPDAIAPPEQEVRSTIELTAAASSADAVSADSLDGGGPSG